MKWDVKIALYLFLAYSLYGLSYVFSNGDYVVPLPMLFILIPIVSLVFLFSSGLNRYTIFHLLLPLGMMSDKISQYSTNISDVASLVSIIAWPLLGALLLIDRTFMEQAKKYKILYTFPIACWSSLLFVLNNPILNLSIFLLLGVVSGLITREDDDKYKLNVSVRRLIILSCFISWMYLITTLSVYLN